MTVTRFLHRAVYVVAVAAMLVCLAQRDEARADIFVLENGARIQGTWLNRGERFADSYRIETAQGGRLSLSKSRVKERIGQRAEQAEYDEIAPTFGNTVEEQWRLAEWCRERHLNDLRAVHLRRIVELEPENLRARHALGYARVGGRWLRRSEVYEERGLVHYRGKWRTPQEVELLEAQEKKERENGEWLARLKRLRVELESENSRQARQEILDIRDSKAVPALVAFLRAEPHRGVKLLYVETLGRIGDNLAIAALVSTTLKEPDVEVFHESVEQIVELKPPGAIRVYIEALKDNNNMRVNRAAYALGKLGDQTAIVPLIESLVTSHQTVVGSPRTGAGTPLTTTFSQVLGSDAAGPLPPGSPGLVAGGSPSVITQAVPNQEALAALVRLSGGVSFGFDKRAWSNWYTTEKAKLGGINRE